MSASVTRRRALVASAAAALGLGVGFRAGRADTTADAALIAQAEALKGLRTRELRAWDDLPDDADVDHPGQEVCNTLSNDVRTAGEALAGVAAVTPAGLAAKASALLALVGRGRWAETEAFSEHHALVASVLRDAAGERGAGSRVAVPPAATADARLGAIAAELVGLQAFADRTAAGAALEPDDPYTVTIRRMDELGAEAAALPADTMGGVLAKLRALALPVIGAEGEDDGPGGAIGRSVCRDVERLHGAGRIAHA